MAESRLPLNALSDTDLEVALRDLGTALSFPSADVAAAVRSRIADAPPPARPWRPFSGLRPMRRGLVLAIAALLVLAAIAGAVGLGLPGIRIFFGEGTPPPPSATSGTSTTPTARASAVPGELLGLGENVTLDEAQRIADFDAILPPDPVLGPPDAVYLAGHRLALVWAPSAAYPPTEAQSVGLLISEFRGHVSDGYYQKVLLSDSRVTPVTVDGSAGYWITGAHYFFYVDETGKEVDETYRIVGDTLIWTTGEMTYRIESSIGMDAAIQLAESLR